MNSRTDRDQYSLAIMSVGAALVVLFAGASVIAAVNHTVPKELWGAASALSGALVGLLVPPPQSKTDPKLAAASAVAFTHAAALGAAGATADRIANDPQSSQPERDAARAAVAQVGTTGASPDQAGAPDPASPIGAAAVRAAVSAHEQNATTARTKADSAATAATDKATNDALDKRDAAQAQREVHDAAAAGARAAAGQADAVAISGELGAQVNFGREALKVIIPFVVFIVALGLALLISSGVVHPSHCSLGGSSGSVPACDGNLLQMGNAMLALAATAGGALIGVFGTPPSKGSGAAK